MVQGLRDMEGLVALPKAATEAIAEPGIARW